MRKEPTYRLYLFDQAKRILRAEVIQASEDKTAIALALTVPQNFGGELWDGERLVQVIDPRLNLGP